MPDAFLESLNGSPETDNATENLSHPDLRVLVTRHAAAVADLF
jgi:hypothetical protein